MLRTRPISVDDMAKDAIALLDSLKIPKAHVIGHSMGTAIAQVLAVRAPEKLNKLVLLNGFAKINFVSTYAFSTIQTLLKQGIDIEIIANAILPWLFSNEFLSDTAKTTLFVKDKMNNPHPQPLQGYKRQFEALRAVDTNSILGKISCPTLILAGDEDILIPLSNAKALLDSIKQSSLAIVPKTGHLSHIEQPADCSKIIHDFLKK